MAEGGAIHADLPEPLVPADVDLSKLDGFMLDTVKLLGSELVALSTGDEFKAAVLLWCRTWGQPRCSLPDDDRILASFAMLPLAKWKRVRPMSLRGYVKCSDGRLYHKVLAADALRAHKAAEQRRAAIRKRWGNGEDGGTKPPTGPNTNPPTKPDTGAGTGAIRPYNGTDTIDGTGRDGTNQNPNDDSEKAAATVVGSFMAIREAIWPNNPNLPSPSATLKTQAAGYLKAGATPELCEQVFRRVAEQKRAKGEGPPTNLGFCRMSIETEIRNGRLDVQTGAQSAKPIAAPGGGEWTPERRDAERRYAAAGERASRDGIKPGHPEYPKRADFGLPEIGKAERVEA